MSSIRDQASLLLADQFSNGSDLPDLTTIQESTTRCRAYSKQPTNSDPPFLFPIIPQIIRFHFHQY